MEPEPVPVFARRVKETGKFFGGVLTWITDEDVQKLLRKEVTIDEAMQFERNYMDDYRDVESFMKYRICGGLIPLKYC